MATGSRWVSAVFIGVVTAGLVAPLVSNVRGPAQAAARTTFTGLDGGTVSGTSPDARATVAIFLSTQCPMANRYGPRIVAL